MSHNAATLGNKAMKPALSVGKLDAAKRQLETAIRLYFNYDDPVSIHTLCAAAYNVIRDLNAKRDGEPMLKDLWRLLDTREAKEFKQLISKAENFFKHANRDPDARYTLNPEETEVLLLEATQRYLQLTGERPALMFVYTTWYVIQHPDIFQKDPEYAKFFAKVDLSAFPDDRKRYFSEFLPIAMAAPALQRVN